MADIPSLTELYTIIILLAPGFLMFRLFIWRTLYEFDFNNMQIVLWSLISSVIVFIPFAAIWRFQSIPDLETRILQYDVIASYFVLAVIIGMIAGEVVRRGWRKNIIRGSVWANFALKNIGDWVEVHTIEEKTYYGWIKLMSTQDKHKRELELSNPEILQTEDNGSSWVEVGNSIIFTEKDISRIILIKR